MRMNYDATGVKMDSSFSPAPEGIYNLVIKKVTDMKEGFPWKTKNGDDYVSVECEIDDAGEYMGTKVWHGIVIMEDKTRKGAGMALHFLKAIQQPWEGKIIIDTDNWIGQGFQAKLIVTKDNKGRPKNEIAFIVDSEKAEEEVPF